MESPSTVLRPLDRNVMRPDSPASKAMKKHLFDAEGWDLTPSQTETMTSDMTGKPIKSQYLHRSWRTSILVVVAVLSGMVSIGGSTSIYPYGARTVMPPKETPLPAPTHLVRVERVARNAAPWVVSAVAFSRELLPGLILTQGPNIGRLVSRALVRAATVGLSARAIGGGKLGDVWHTCTTPVRSVNRKIDQIVGSIAPVVMAK